MTERRPGAKQSRNLRPKRKPTWGAATLGGHVTDHDELLARAERWMLSSDYDIETAGKLIRDLAAALRAALAAQAEPLFEGELFEFTGDGRAAMIRRVDASSWPFVARKGLRNTRVVVYAANPAAPQEDT